MKNIYKIVCLAILIGSSTLLGQEVFEFAFNFLKPNIDHTLMDIQLLDFDDDSEDEIAVSFKSDSSWYFYVIEKNSTIAYEYNQLIEPGYALRKCLTFNFNNSWYLLAVKTFNPYKEEIQLELIDLNTKIIIDIETFHPYYQGFIDEILAITDLQVLSNSIDLNFCLGYQHSYSGSGPGVNYSGTESYLTTFSFDDSITINDTYDKINQFIYPGNIAFGTNSYSSSVPKNFKTNSSTSILHFYSAFYDNLSGLIERELLFKSTNGPGYFLISSDDSSNMEYGVTFFKHVGTDYSFVNFSSGTAEIIWENFNTNINRKVTLASNLSSESFPNHLIYFHQYGYSASMGYEIRDRISGEPVISGVAPFIPIKITEASNNKLYYISFWGSTYTFYSLKNNIVNVNEKNNIIEFRLNQNYPNPFNPTTKISYYLSNSQFVTLTVYDYLGNELKTLFKNFQDSGYHQLEFDGSDLASGVYFYKMITKNNSLTKKMLLIK